MSEPSAVYAVETPIGTVNVVVHGVNEGVAWIDGAVIVNRIPHDVSRVQWSKGADDKIRAGSAYSVRRTDTTYPEQTTWNAYKKITQAIEAAVAQVMENEGPRFQHLGRLAELRLSKEAREFAVEGFRREIEDLLQRIAKEERAIEILADCLEFLEGQEPGEFEQQVAQAAARGEQAAREALAELDVSTEDDWSKIWALENEARAMVRRLEEQFPVPRITAAAAFATHGAYIKVCDEARDALREASYANR